MTRPDVGAPPFDPTRVLVVDGGPHLPVMPSMPTPTLVIAADKGFEHAQALGLKVDVVVGDFDSVAPEDVENVDPGVTVERHDDDKDDICSSHHGEIAEFQLNQLTLFSLFK